MSVNAVVFQAWQAAVLAGGDPEEWATRLGSSLEEILRSAEVDMSAIAKVMVNRRKEEVLNLFPPQLRPYIVLTAAKPAKPRRTGDASSTAGTGDNVSSTGIASRGKAYTPRLDRYVWQYKGKMATIRRVGGDWEAWYDEAYLGMFPSHTKAVEAVYRHCGVEAAINAVKLARMREQEAAAGLAD